MKSLFSIVSIAVVGMLGSLAAQAVSTVHLRYCDTEERTGSALSTDRDYQRIASSLARFAATVPADVLFGPEKQRATVKPDSVTYRYSGVRCTEFSPAQGADRRGESNIEASDDIPITEAPEGATFNVDYCSKAVSTRVGYLKQAEGWKVSDVTQSQVSSCPSQ